jgi:site-specific DNA-methyltransferase (adenine-specific)
MKPLSEKTYVDQALRNGKGITWLDDARIPSNTTWQSTRPSGSWEGGELQDIPRASHDSGRFPANLLASDEVLGEHSRFFSLDAWAEKLPPEVREVFPFLIVPKAAKSEKGEDNVHPTVKPLKLMQYLVTLGSRPGDLVLDPFSGSGSTCVAAKLLDRHYIGIDLSLEYCRIAVHRIAAHQPDNTLFKAS